eukprot:95602-Amorphochlora_amoeboformis.AAC.1
MRIHDIDPDVTLNLLHTNHKKLSVTTNTIAHEQMEKYDLDQDGIITASEFFSGYLNKHFHIDDPLKMQLLSE